MKKLRSVLAALLCLSLIACSQQPTPSQSGGEVVSGGGNPPEISSSAPSDAPSDGSVAPQSDISQNAGNAVIENIPQEEQQAYIKKYLRPYYIVGLLDTTWSDPEEIEVWRYMHFFTYNEDYNYYTSLEYTLYRDHSVPAEVVEEYVTRYFEVDPAYLRTSEKYDASANCYRSMANEGIGDGPGVTIERIEKDGDIWKFICRDISDNLLSVTIRVEDENSFHYIAGEVLERAESPKTEERFDPMALGDHANALTEHIVLSVFRGEAINNGDCPLPEEKDMLLFTLGTVFLKDREEYGYHNVAYQSEDRFFHFSEEGIKNMVYEVFGFENWTPDKSITGRGDYRGDSSQPLAYNAQEKDFSGGLEFGFGNGMECKFMATVIDTQDMKVIVDYDLYTSSLFPYQHKVATMSTDYAILFREDGTPYLRYEGTVVDLPQE